MQVYTAPDSPNWDRMLDDDVPHGRAAGRVRADPQDRTPSRHDHRAAQRQGDGRVPPRRRASSAPSRCSSAAASTPRRRCSPARSTGSTRASDERPRLVDDSDYLNTATEEFLRLLHARAGRRPHHHAGLRGRRLRVLRGRPHVPVVRDVQPRPRVVPEPRRDRARPVPEPARRVRARRAPLHRLEPRPPRLQAHAAGGAAAHARLPHRPRGHGAVRVDRHDQRLQAPPGDVHARATARARRSPR